MNYVSAVKRVYRVLERHEYRPVIVGTYALILQGWLPSYYEKITKDVDIYVGDPMIVIEDALYKKLSTIGLQVGRSDSGRISVDEGKSMEIVYPLLDFYILMSLLEEITIIDKLRILEGHTVLISKTLDSDI